MPILQIGELVYRPFEPKKIGRVEAVGPDPHAVSVRWQDGQVAQEASFRLKSHNVLMRETEKKLANHRRRREELLAAFGVPDAGLVTPPVDKVSVAAPSPRRLQAFSAADVTAAIVSGQSLRRKP